MTSTSSSTVRRLLGLAAVGAAVAGVLVATTGQANAGTSHAGVPAIPVTSGSTYLALGDSVSFGFRESTTKPTPDYSDAQSFVGFPEMIARDLGLQLTNLACPGETSASLVDSTKQSYGCESEPGGGPGYRTAYPLKTTYTGSQLAYALQFLAANPDTRLITLMVGANDGFLCQATTADHCTSPSELQGVLTTVDNNVTTIIKSLRNKAHYGGQIVIVNYYSTNYNSRMASGQSALLNNSVDNTVKNLKLGVLFADGYGAFKRAARNAGGNTCRAGLLTYTVRPTPTSQGTCGVHPSLGGHALLAGAVEQVLRK